MQCQEPMHAITNRIPVARDSAEFSVFCLNLRTKRDRGASGVSLLRSSRRNIEMEKSGTSLEAREEQLLFRSESVVARVVGGETLIVPIRGKVGDLASIYRLNGAGSLIWKLLESPITVSQLTAKVAEEFAIDADLAQRDVQEFVREMKNVGLVEFPTAAAMYQ